MVARGEVGGGLDGLDGLHGTNLQREVRASGHLGELALDAGPLLAGVGVALNAAPERQLVASRLCGTS